MKSLLKSLIIFFSYLILLNAETVAQLDSVIFTSSNLPLVLIDTEGQTIHNSYRIVANMESLIIQTDKEITYLIHLLIIMEKSVLKLEAVHQQCLIKNHMDLKLRILLEII